MSTHVIEYELLRELPTYPAGTIIKRTYTLLPSMYREGSTYISDENYMVGNTHAITFLAKLIERCVGAKGNDEYDGWIKELSHEVQP